MSNDINKIINELHIYEKKVLKELEKDENASPEEISQRAGLNIKSVMSEHQISYECCGIPFIKRNNHCGEEGR